MTTPRGVGNANTGVRKRRPLRRPVWCSVANGGTQSEIVPRIGLVTRRLTRVTHEGIGMEPTLVRRPESRETGRVGAPRRPCDPSGGLDRAGLAQRTPSCALRVVTVTVEVSDEPPREGWRPRQWKESLV